MITIEHHPEKPDKYLMTFKPTGFTLVIDEEEHQAIINYGRPKITLHPMSEEPKFDDAHIWLIRQTGEFKLYRVFFWQGSWESAKHYCSEYEGWLYESELSQLIKDNTAP